ncbi:MAG: hypothetical protein MUF03_13745 [Rubrivivax sp.]|jgi:hypothetical protein|nr:hypothetical protein [Rubrivivax sp.]
MASTSASKTSKRLQAALLLAGALAAGPAAAQGNAQGLLDNSFVFNAGGFLLSTDVEATLNGQSTVNPQLDFNETFGLGDDATRARVDALWRITPRHHLRFMYFNNTETRTRVIDRDVEWGDYVFLANGEISAETSFKVYQLSYEYAFAKAPAYEWAASLGVHVTDLGLSLAGNANVVRPDGSVVAAGFATEAGEALAPLPVIGLRAGWAFAPNWYLDAQAQLFGLSVDEYDGSWSDLRLGVTWMFHRHFGVGLGYNRFAVDVDVEKTNFNGNLKVSYSGLQLYLTGTF